MQLSKLNLLAVSIAVISTPTFANEVPTLTLPEIAITATRTPTPLKNTIAQTTVIDEDELQRYQGQSVLDVLRQQGSFQVRQYGGDGTAGSFILRGYDEKRILVLIDGIRYGSISYGGSALSLIPADQIDRIEVLHGASGSSLYGADAMGGVIQIFTKGLNANQSNVAVTVGAGTENSYKGQVTGQYVNQNKNSVLSLSAGYEKTDGISAVKNATGVDSDKDGFESKNASLVAKHHFNGNIAVGVTGLVAKSTTDIDYENRQEQENGAISAFVDYQKDKLSTSLKYGQSFDKIDAFATPNTSTPNVYNTKQKQLNLQMGYQLPVGKMIAGYERLEQLLDVSDTASYVVKDRDIDSAFVGYQLATDKYDAQANVRHDKNSQFGSETTYSLGGAYRVLPNTRVGASYATGFKAPSMNDLYGYSDDWGGYRGNPNLKAETSKNWEVFAENSNQYHKTRLTGYQSKLTDGLFDQRATPSTTINQDEVKIQGINLTSDWKVNNLLFGLNYDYQKTENTKGANKDKELTHRPNHKGVVYVGYQQLNYDIRAEVQYLGERFTTADNTREMGGYSLLNISGNYYLSPNWTINTRINNLTGKEYETIYGYNQKGVNAFVSATYKWF